MLHPEYKKILRYIYIGLILLVIFFCFMDYIPMMENLVRLKVKISILKNSVKALSAAEKDKQERELQNATEHLRQEFEVVRKSTEDVKQQAKTDRNIPLVTLQIEDLANLSRIELTLIKPLMGEDESLHEILPIEIGFQSTYVRLIDFIKRLEDCPILLSVRDLSVTKDEVIYPALEVKMILDVLFRGAEDKAQTKPAEMDTGK